MTAAGGKALLDNGFAAVGLRRAAGGGLPGDNFRFHVCLRVRVVEKLLQFGFDNLFVFPGTMRRSSSSSQLSGTTLSAWPPWMRVTVRLALPTRS